MCSFSMLIPILAGRRAFSQSATRQSYENTIQNLRVHKDTKVLFAKDLPGKTVRDHRFAAYPAHIYHILW